MPSVGPAHAKPRAPAASSSSVGACTLIQPPPPPNPSAEATPHRPPLPPPRRRWGRAADPATSSPRPEPDRTWPPPLLLLALSACGCRLLPASPRCKPSHAQDRRVLALHASRSFGAPRLAITACLSLPTPPLEPSLSPSPSGGGERGGDKAVGRERKEIKLWGDGTLDF